MIEAEVTFRVSAENFEGLAQFHRDAGMSPGDGGPGYFVEAVQAEWREDQG